MKKLVFVKGKKVGILGFEWKQSGIWYIAVERTNVHFPRKQIQKTFKKSDCTIVRVKTPLEIWFIIKVLRQTPYSKYLKK